MRQMKSRKREMFSIAVELNKLKMKVAIKIAGRKATAPTHGRPLSFKLTPREGCKNSVIGVSRLIKACHIKP